MSKRKKPSPPPAPPPETWPKVVETFAHPDCALRDLGHSAFCGPSVGNGDVRVVRYRVTVEPIDEPEAVAGRIRTLWRLCSNHHEWQPLRAAAKRHGVTLDDAERGVDAPRRW
jgi:hypothetical protein